MRCRRRSSVLCAFSSVCHEERAGAYAAAPKGGVRLKLRARLFGGTDTPITSMVACSVAPRSAAFACGLVSERRRDIQCRCVWCNCKIQVNKTAMSIFQLGPNGPARHFRESTSTISLT